MAFFQSLPENPRLRHVFDRFKSGVRQIMELHDILLRDPSPLSVGEREMIAGYVSGLNACEYCYAGHADVAAAFGMNPGILKALLADIGGSGVDEKLKPILRYVRKLTLTPAKMIEADALAVFEAGWSEQALFDAVSICALFNYMNRLVEGMGIKNSGQNPNLAGLSAESRRKIRYIDVLNQLGIGRQP